MVNGGVAAVVKHFAGYGAVKDGWDSHTHYGRFATFPGGRFEAHVAAFRPSFRVPSSMVAARAQKPDVPHDSRDPLYRIGFGLSY